MWPVGQGCCRAAEPRSVKAPLGDGVKVVFEYPQPLDPQQRRPVEATHGQVLADVDGARWSGLGVARREAENPIPDGLGELGPAP